MKKLILLVASLFFLITQLIGKEKINYELYSVAFYNVENLFDTIPEPNDHEYTPTGAMQWDSKKYWAKMKNMSYAISKIGSNLSPMGPSILGLAEVENRSVLEDLVKQEAIKHINYQIIHIDGGDPRGVDCALLYNPRDFYVTNVKSYPYYTSSDSSRRSRDQLVVSGILSGEEIHVIVNHWPSRRGGEVNSRPRRVAAAQLTKHIADSIFTIDKNAKIIIMGDLNDDPINESVKDVLNAKQKKSETPEGGLYNTTWELYNKGIGSLAYGDAWNLFDQIIVSSGLIGKDKAGLTFWKAEIFQAPFLIRQEGQYKGYPFRTHAGGVYQNGYSDHFPSIIYLIKRIDNK
ncbi:MAG TPA: endonuclease/exonuclease/phosphatase family protein [Paludibacteraceae bacterium]|nr:endonuclease/exonuclease/phosphatase family protein [Paludibacteraceae bacterium]